MGVPSRGSSVFKGGGEREQSVFKVRWGVRVGWFVKARLRAGVDDFSPRVKGATRKL